MAWGTVGWDQTGGGGGADPLVPYLIGLTEVEAGDVLIAAGLVVGTDTTGSSETIAVDKVFYSDPVANTVVTAGSAVNIVLSTGPAGEAVGDYIEYEVKGAPASYITPLTIDSGATCPNGLALPSGDIALCYNVAGKITMAVMNSAMTELRYVQSGTGATPGYHPVCALLSNGNVACGWVDDNNYYTQFCIFNPTLGTLVKDITEVAQDARYDDGYRICSFPGPAGGFAIFTDNANTACAIIENNGDIRVNEFAIMTGSPYATGAGLTNGNFLLLTSDLEYAIHKQSDGSEIQAISNFSGLISAYGFTNQVMTNPVDGTIHFCYTAEIEANNDRAYKTVFDGHDGRLLYADYRVFPSNSSRHHNAFSTFLASGAQILNFVTLTSERKLYYSQADIFGSILNSEVVNGFGTANAQGTEPCLQFGDGSVIIFHVPTEGFVKIGAVV